MHTHTTRRLRTRLMVPLSWLGFLAAMAGAAAVAMTLIAWAGGYALATLVAGLAALALFATAGSAYAVSKRNGRDETLQHRMGRLRRAKYRSAYPPDAAPTDEAGRPLRFRTRVR